MSGLNITHVHRNLHTRVTFLCLEFEDAFVILGIAALTNVLGRFLHREIAGIPVNILLQYVVPVLAIPLLIAFKYGKASDQIVTQTLQASQNIEDEAAQAAPGSAAYLTGAGMVAAVENQAMMQRMLAAELREEAAILAHSNAIRKRQADLAGQFRQDTTTLFK